MPASDNARDDFAPLVTVIIRSYNRIPELRALVHRVLGQSYRQLEVLVVDSALKTPLEN